MCTSNQFQAPLFEAVKKYVDCRVTPFHVPGHKQGKGISEFRKYVGERVLQMDANGMEDLDYLSNPLGPIYEAQKLLADAYQAKQAFFLVNGTTSGIQAMILSVCSPGDKIIIQRNCHRSAISGIILSGAIPVYVQPEVNYKLGISMNVSVEAVKNAIKCNPDAKAIFIVNPTYYGYTCDLETITNLAHKNNMLVLVDEAHGAHMHFHNEFPKTAMSVNADMSAVSIHKTGGSMTQSSALLVAGDYVISQNVAKTLNLINTTSASYVLMTSLDVARKQLATEGKELLENTLKISRYARKSINNIKGIYAFGKELLGTPGCYDFDETKLGVNISNLGYNGYEMEVKLRNQYNIQIEMADMCNILAIISLGDSANDVNFLINALANISSQARISEKISCPIIPMMSKCVVPPREAFYCCKKNTPLDKCEGKISGEMLMAYPPGIPIICLGEIITKELIEYIKLLKKEKCKILGQVDPLADIIQVLG